MWGVIILTQALSPASRPSGPSFFRYRLGRGFSLPPSCSLSWPYSCESCVAPVHVWMLKIVLITDVRDSVGASVLDHQRLQGSGQGPAAGTVHGIPCWDVFQSGWGRPSMGRPVEGLVIASLYRSPVPWILWDGVRIWSWQSMKTKTTALSFPKTFLLILQIVFLCGLSCIHSLMPLSKLSFTQRMLLEYVPCTSHRATVMDE